ncbi:MAG: hypothetical protein GC137_10110 [Alphaproteobacteria bacterium]|nr:hypothetical protein [Alphaproteobacteria bacterium]
MYEAHSILENPYMWYTLSFLILCFIIYKFGGPAINKYLDGRIEDIKRDLQEAESLRVEAQEMLAQYQRKHRDAVQESEKILQKAKENAEKFRKTAEAELEAVMKRREQQLEERLKRMEQNAIDDIKSYAAQLAMNAAEQIVIDQLDKKTNTKLVDHSIDALEKNLH